MTIMQAVQKTIDDFYQIIKKRIVVYDRDAVEIAGAGNGEEPDHDAIREFFKSSAKSQEISGTRFFKISEENEALYVLLIRGDSDELHILGKLVCAQIQNILTIFHERESVSLFIQNLIMDNLLQVDIYNRAKRLHIPMELDRVVFVIETKDAKDNDAAQLLKHLFTQKVYISAVDEYHIVLIVELNETEGRNLEKIAKTILDMLNSEIMSQVRIGYGGIMDSLKDISRSYKEAKLALDVGKIFYPSRMVISYESLGIGRLIYQLPIHLCEMFMEETFEETPMDALDEETILTVVKFFENNLNVSETARQLYVHRNTLVYRLEKLQKMTGLDVRQFEDALTFRIAMMVSNYMNYIKENQDD